MTVASAAPPDEAAVRAMLDTIIDPCSAAARLPAGLDEMGLVRAIAITPAQAGVLVSLTLDVTHPFCMMAAIFMAEAERRVAAMPGVAAVEICLYRGEIWTPERMAPAYRARLAAARN